MRGFRTDLAMESVGEESGRLEGVSMSAHQIGGVKRTRIVIQSRRAAEVLQRPVGEYITLECPELSRCGQPERPMLIRLIAQAVRALGGFDLILCGRQAIDGDTAQVGPMLAEHLGLPQLTCACAITIEDGAIRIRQEGERAYRVLRAPLPAVVTVVKAINEPRLPNVMRKLQANRMQPQTLTADDLPALDPDCIGLHGSPTKVSKTFVPVRTKQTVRIDGAQPEAAVASLLAQLDAAHISLEGGGDHV